MIFSQVFTNMHICWVGPWFYSPNSACCRGSHVFGSWSGANMGNFQPIYIQIGKSPREEGVGEARRHPGGCSRQSEDTAVSMAPKEVYAAGVMGIAAWTCNGTWSGALQPINDGRMHTDNYTDGI